MASYPTPLELAAIYAKREAAMVRLGKKATIELSDLDDLDRLGRFQVVDILWSQCSREVQNRLRNDEHPHVRSAVRVADDRQANLPAAEVRNLMRRYKITIRDLARRMNITMKRVREVREQGVLGKCRCQDWREAISGTGLFVAEDRR